MYFPTHAFPLGFPSLIMSREERVRGNMLSPSPAFSSFSPGGLSLLRARGSAEGSGLC